MKRFIFAPALVGFYGMACLGCTTIDPGPNFVVSNEQFNDDYFFCHVEPEVLFAKKCGSGDTAAGDPGGGCHFNASAVSGLALIDHPPVNCAGGEHPVDRSTVGSGSGAQSNFQSASLEMNRDYQSAPIFVRPLGFNHPRAIFQKGDPVETVLRTWAEHP